MQTLKQHQLHAKFSKREFWLNRVAFFGHVISKDGVMVDHAKIEAISNWKRPTNASEIRSFLSLVGYYGKFVADFSKLAMPPTMLNQKGRKFKWIEECKKSFQELKRQLISASILTILEEDEGLVIYSNTSKMGFNVVM